MKKIIIAFLICSTIVYPIFAQQNTSLNEKDRVKMEHAQIGFVDDNKSGYKHNEHPDAQWFANAGFGMFIHWNIASIKKLDLSWPMMAGTQIGWRAANNKMDSSEVRKIMQSGDYFAGHSCKADNSCVTPNEYWDQARYFNPTKYDPEEWVKAAKEAGMTYAVLTTRHHDGFAMWPSNYGNFNTTNYMGGKDLVKSFVKACRKYGIKVGLYYSGPDWYFNKSVQSFMYYGVARDYPNIPSLDADLHPRTTIKTEVEKQPHYDSVAVYIKGQVEELLTNYGKIDMIWFDGGPDIPKGNNAWNNCITMKKIHELQPGIIVSPRFFGYGDYKTYEADKALPTAKQKDWAELCTTVQKKGWGYTGSPLKPVSLLLKELILCRSRNTNFLLNFSPDKDGLLSIEQNEALKVFAKWMKSNCQSLTNCVALSDMESASVPATAQSKHRYLFLLPDDKSGSIQLKTTLSIKRVKLLENGMQLKYDVKDDVITIETSSIQRTDLADVVDIELK